MSGENTRWVLAFDASCGTCREVSSAVARASRGKLEVLPLTHPDVRRWRVLARVDDTRSAPTLLRVQGAAVRAWTGGGMSLPLTRRLGLRSTTRVLRSLGQLRRQANGHPLERPGTISRAGFLRIGAGAIVAAGIVFAGKAPAFAEQTCKAARAWVEANKHRLPESYDAIVEYPIAYRRAIFAELRPAVKGRLWTQHVNRYRDSHPGLSTAQIRVIDDIVAVATDPSTFEPNGRQDQILRPLRESVMQAFGHDEARALVATLGTEDEAIGTAVAPDCDCNTKEANYCPVTGVCIHRRHNCVESTFGCGTFWLNRCNGGCTTD